MFIAQTIAVILASKVRAAASATQIRLTGRVDVDT